MVVETVKSALKVSTGAPLLVHANTLHTDTLPSKVLVLKMPGTVGLHCSIRQEQQGERCVTLWL